MPATAKQSSSAMPARRVRDPEATRRRVLDAAKGEFARLGFAGARVAAIAARARINKQLLYHYFGNKEGLYLAVLERAYGDIRESESRLDVEHLAPLDALKTMVEFTWNYYLDHPEFLALVSNENLHKAAHMRRSEVIGRIHAPFRARLASILTRGVRAGVFRRGVDADQLNLTIAAIGYYYLTNRHTNSIIYETDLMAPAALSRRLSLQPGDHMPDGDQMRPVALITGAARGIGRGCALRLARSGFDLALVDRDGEDQLASLAAEVAALGAASIVYVADVADLATHDAMIAAAAHRFGHLHCLVNNAGVGVMRRGDLLDVTPESFDRCIAVNTRAVFFLCQAAARHMLALPEIAGPHRSIINITSSNAVAVSVSRGEYCVSKTASSMTTQLFGLRLAEAGIGVYEIRPGVIETGMTAPVKADYDARIAAGLVPAKRWGYPADVAETVALMAEGRMPYTVGQAVAVDGGLITPRF